MGKSMIAKSLMILILSLCFIGRFTTPIYSQESPVKNIKGAMAELQVGALKLGEPKIEGSSLFFGNTKMNMNYELVDGIASKYKCTATLFLAKDEMFYRVSTNVIKDGNRAIGTPLDQKGPVIVSIKKGESYYGVVDILGKMYDTGYEPIVTKEGKTLGVYYIGYPVEK